MFETTLHNVVKMQQFLMYILDILNNNVSSVVEVVNPVVNGLLRYTCFFSIGSFVLSLDLTFHQHYHGNTNLRFVANTKNKTIFLFFPFLVYVSYHHSVWF